jgi:transposase
MMLETMMEATGAQMHMVRCQLLAAARHQGAAAAAVWRRAVRRAGAGLLARRGGSPPPAKAVRFAGLDVTVYSSDGKRSPGRLSRRGPPVLRWALYEADKAHARSSVPDHGCFA